MEESNNQARNSFFSMEEVESGGIKPLKLIFQTLLLQKKCKQQELADYCDVDKSYISKTINGHYIPDLRMRLKIASFFGVDTSVIWRVPQIQSADKIREEQSENSPSNTQEVCDG